MRSILIALALTLGLVSCAVTSGSLAADGAPPALVAQFAELEEAEVAADAAVAEAEESGDLTRLTEARGVQAAIKSELQILETEVLHSRGSVVASAVTAFTGPAGAPLSAAILGLAPLLGRRGRKHYAKAITNLTPFAGETAAPAPIRASLDLLRAWGFLHSSKKTEEVFEEETTIQS